MVVLGGGGYAVVSAVEATALSDGGGYVVVFAAAGAVAPLPPKRDRRDVDPDKEPELRSLNQAFMRRVGLGTSVWIGGR